MSESQRENEVEQEGGDSGITSPPEGTNNQSTTPPGNGEVDQDALDKGRENLEQAGGGH